jgi:hypothetical protein
MNSIENFSDYIICGDETGDHNLDNVNPENPIFGLAFCFFKKSEYLSIAQPLITEFKMKFWGHDLAILHNHAIRKSAGDFSFLSTYKHREIFLNELNRVITQIPFKIITVSIDKRALPVGATHTHNPYFLALEFCLEHVYRYLEKALQLDKSTPIIVESRGLREDKELRIAFNAYSHSFLIDGRCPFSLYFANKKINHPGLQIADLVAYPIARYSIKPTQANRAFEIVRLKLQDYLEWDERGAKKLFSLKT